MRDVADGFNGPEKAKDREASLTVLKQEAGFQPFRTALFLPGIDALDVKQALHLGVITEETEVYFVESDDAVLERLRAVRRSLPIKRVELFRGSLEDFRENVQFDYVRADLMGNFTGKLGLWWEETFSKRLAKHAVVLVTLCHHPRNNDFRAWFDGHMTKDKLLREASDAFRFRAVQGGVPNTDVNDIVPMILMQCAGQKHQFTWNYHNKYCDTVWMVTCQAKVTPSRDLIWPSMGELYQTYLCNTADDLAGRIYDRHKIIYDPDTRTFNFPGEEDHQFSLPDAAEPETFFRIGPNAVTPFHRRRRA